MPPVIVTLDESWATTARADPPCRLTSVSLLPLNVSRVPPLIVIVEEWAATAVWAEPPVMMRLEESLKFISRPTTPPSSVTSALSYAFKSKEIEPPVMMTVEEWSAIDD